MSKEDKSSEGKLTTENIVEVVQKILQDVENLSPFHVRLLNYGYVEKAPTQSEDADKYNKWRATHRDHRPLSGDELVLYMIRMKRGSNVFGQNKFSYSEVEMELDDFVKNIREVFAKYLSSTQMQDLKKLYGTVWKQWANLPNLVITDAQAAIERLQKSWDANKFDFTEGQDMEHFVSNEEQYYYKNNLLARAGAFGDAKTEMAAMTTTLYKLPDSVAGEKRSLVAKVVHSNIQNYTQLKRELSELNLSHQERTAQWRKELKLQNEPRQSGGNRGAMDEQPVDNPDSALTALATQVSELMAMVTAQNGSGRGGRVCYEFRDSGTCRRGDRCTFNHDRGGSNRGGRGRGGARGGARGGRRQGRAHQQNRTGVCFAFRDSGSCRFGDECRFAHNGERAESEEDSDN